MANDLFRLVNLRHSKSSGEHQSPLDPRLRLRPILDAQHDVKALPKDQQLRDWKAHHKALTRKVADLEAIQIALLNSEMVEMQSVADEPHPTTVAESKDGDSVESKLVRAAPIKPVSFENVTRGAEVHLTEAQTAIFHTMVGNTHGNLSDLAGALDVGPILVESNELCMQIKAVEDDLGDGLPTITPPTDPAGQPIIAAVGWGDLVVARESLVGYHAHEISHIENILPGESKLRELETVSKSELVTENETTTEKESEKDSQSTDRYELQAQSQETINRDFSVSTGVNTSGQYGLTQVDTSLDAAFSQNQSQSQSNTIDTAREIVTKAVERTFERVRVLRRLTITEQIRELNRHKVENEGGSEAAQAISGIYLWVEKIQKVELRQYGTRMMVEFHVPEPAISLFEQARTQTSRKSLPPFNVSPASVQPGNYMCLAQQYGAVDVEPPPGLFIDVGWGWTSSTNEDAEAYGEDQFTAMINIPTGYRPTWAKVAWSALKGKQENREFNFAFSIGGRSQGIEHTVNTYDGVVLALDTDADWPQGVPVSGRLHGAWDGAMYVQAKLRCIRTAEALDAWRLKIWQALRAGYEVLQRQIAQQQQQQAYQDALASPTIQDLSEQENRRIERNELQKWAIKSMRRVPQNFNAIEQVEAMQEVSPIFAEAQSPIVRFYEDSFEWENMNYFFYPYHWARRASWRMRTAAQSSDPQHQAFLEAGAARVIVPVTPGFEDKVSWFLDPTNAELDELDRILTLPPDAPPTTTTETFRDLWMELLTDRKPDVARGSGTLKVESGSVSVTINADSRWSVSSTRDIGREIYVAGNQYIVAAVTSDNAFTIDRPYEGASDAAAPYVAGSVPFGPPWTVRVPTSLIVLSENVATLKTI